MPVTLRRCFIKGQIPPTGERFDGGCRDLSFAHEITFGPDDDDGNLGEMFGLQTYWKAEGGPIQSLLSGISVSEDSRLLSD
jgi:hypothetical protein